MRLLSLPFIAIAFGCGATPITELQYRHSLSVRPSGGPERLEVTLPGPNGPVTSEVQTREQVAVMKAQIAEPGVRRVLIYVHGGLNSTEEGLERTARLAPLILAETGGSTYPIFINWNSQLGSSYWDHLFHYRKGRRVADFWGAVSSPFILVADVGRALARLPIVFWDQGSAAANRLWRTVQPAAIPPRWRDRVVLDERYEWSALATWSDAVTQVVPGVLRVITTPLIDTVGFEGYRLLERRIDTLFRRNEDLRSRSERPKGVLYELMEAIKPEIEIVLIGHSMGTIVLNELIRRFPRHNFRHIVYMGAACTTKDFMDAVPAYLTRNSASEFYGLCLHPAADENEVTAWSTVPNGSLLEWLDAYVLGPRTQLHRTFGKWNNAVRALSMFNDLHPCVAKRIHLKGFPVVGDQFPNHHGAFDEYRFWAPEYWSPANDQPVATVEQARAALAVASPE